MSDHVYFTWLNRWPDAWRRALADEIEQGFRFANRSLWNKWDMRRAS